MAYRVEHLRKAEARARTMPWSQRSLVTPIARGWHIQNRDGSRETYEWLWYERWLHRKWTPMPSGLGPGRRQKWKLK